MNFSFILFTFIVGYVSADTYGDKGPRCYDCNYAPSGYVLSKGAEYLAKVGYHSCALRTPYDKKNVDKWGCKSGMCFIRKDYNGLVYRGCANKENLPWAVDPNVNCQYQGASKSLYYFCKGDICNEAMLGESPELCGAPVPPVTTNGNQKYEKMGAASNGYEIQDQQQGQQGYQQQGQQGYVDQQQGQQGYVDQQQGYSEQQQQGYPPQNMEYPPENQVQQQPNAYQSMTLGKDVCNGDCSYNPSGLFPYDNEGKYFIQCEADVRSYGNKGTHPCTCCKPTVLPCPYGASFSDVDKVCSYKLSYE